MAAESAINPILMQLFPQELRKGDLRKIRILEAAILCAGTIGIEEMTLDAIAKRLKTTRSHIAYYFPKRADLIEGILRYSVAHLQDMTVKKMATIRAPKGKIKAMVEAAFAWARAYPEQRSVFILFIYYGSISRDLRDLHTEVRDSASRRIQGILLEELGLGVKIRPEILWARAKEIHWAMLGGFFDAQSTGSGGKDRDVEARVVKTAIRTYEQAVRCLVESLG